MTQTQSEPEGKKLTCWVGVSFNSRCLSTGEYLAAPTVILVVEDLNIFMRHCPKCTFILSSSVQAKKWQFVPILDRKSGLVDRLRKGVCVPSGDPMVAINDACQHPGLFSF